jgi:hypothetical protein
VTTGEIEIAGGIADDRKIPIEGAVMMELPGAVKLPDVVAV